MKIAGYETTFITRNELADDGLKTLQEKLNAAIAGFDGEIVLHEDWGNRKLAAAFNSVLRFKKASFSNSLSILTVKNLITNSFKKSYC
jgi:ribosomal protein S6